MLDFLSSHALEILGVVLGLIYLLLELKASWWMWVVGAVMPINSLFVYYKAGLYADFSIDIYYVLVGFYGLWMWLRGGVKKPSLPISATPVRLWAVLAGVFAVLFVAIGLVLVNFTDSSVPWSDSFTTALSIIGLWMLARKWIEQWWVWFVVDAASTALYVYKGIYFYAGLYLLYTVLAVYGFYKWRKMLSLQNGQETA
ncbi:MAG: nicotinamide riboside transporter PnuC [Bacteroidales bacterium]|nr:nicotinamide riboside transporter PnuC [Bacteroidales bacterium]